MIGDPDCGPLIEVVTDQVHAGELHVSHAMSLTSAVAREVLEVTGGPLDVTGQVDRRLRSPQEES